ncbi:hypothetical protein QEN19_003346 [Hanseniaspora menglaensis]
MLSIHKRSLGSVLSKKKYTVLALANEQPLLQKLFISVSEFVKNVNNFTFPGLELFSKQGLWLAVPKQRSSYSKKRQRQLDLQKRTKLIPHLDACPICGHYKRKHTLCMNCMNKAKDFLYSFIKKEPRVNKQDQILLPEEKSLLYNARKGLHYEKSLLKKQENYEKRKEMKRNIKETLPFEKK